MTFLRLFIIWCNQFLYLPFTNTWFHPSNANIPFQWTLFVVILLLLQWFSHSFIIRTHDICQSNYSYGFTCYVRLWWLCCQKHGKMMSTWHLKRNFSTNGHRVQWRLGMDQVCLICNCLLFFRTLSVNFLLTIVKYHVLLCFFTLVSISYSLILWSIISSWNSVMNSCEFKFCVSKYFISHWWIYSPYSSADILRWALYWCCPRQKWVTPF